MKNKKRSTILGNLEETVASQPVSGKEEQRQSQRMSRESILNSIGSMAQGGSGERSPINAAYEQRTAQRENARAQRYNSFVTDYNNWARGLGRGRAPSGEARQMLDRAQDVWNRGTQQDRDEVSGIIEALRSDINASRTETHVANTMRAMPKGLQRQQQADEQWQRAAAQNPELAARWAQMDADAYTKKAEEARRSATPRYNRFGVDTGYLGEDAGTYAEQQRLAEGYTRQARYAQEMYDQAEQAVRAQRLAEMEKSLQERPQTYTAENVGDYLDRARYLASLTSWTQEQREEAQEIREALVAPAWKDSYISREAKRAAQEGRAPDQEISQLASDLDAGLHPVIQSGVGSFLRGTGALSAAETVGNVLGDDTMQAQLSGFERRAALAADQGGTAGKIAQTVGGTAGSLALMGAAGELIGSAAPKIAGFSKIPAALQTGAKTAMTFALTDAVKNAGALSAGRMTAGEYLSEAARSGVSGAAGSLAGGMVSSGIARTLAKHDLMTPFMEYVRNLSSSMTFAAAQLGTDYAMTAEEDRPNGQEMAEQLLTSFLFSAINSGIETARTTKANKAAVEQAVRNLQEEYARLSQSGSSPEEIRAAGERILRYSEEVRGAISQHYYAGQQKSIDEVRAALDMIDSRVNGILSGTVDTAAGNRLGGTAWDASAPVGEALPDAPAGGSTGTPTVYQGSGTPESTTESAQVQAQLQGAIAQGVQDAARQQEADSLYQEFGETARGSLPEAQSAEEQGAELQREFGEVYRENRAAEQRAAERPATAQQSGAEAATAQRQAQTPQRQQRAAETQETAQTAAREETRTVSRKAAERGAQEQQTPQAARRRASYVRPTGGTAVAGTDILRVERSENGGTELVRTDGSRAALDAVETAGTALEVLEQAAALPEHNDPLTLNGMLRAYEVYLGGQQSTQETAEAFFDNYTIALYAGIEGERRQTVLGYTQDAAMQRAMETGYSRGVEIAKGQSLAGQLGSAGAAALERYDYRYADQFGAFYQAGQEGLSFKEATRMAGLSSMGETRKAEMTAAWEAGRKDGNDYETYSEDLGFEAERGEPVSLDRSERDAGMGSGEPAGALGGRAGKADVSAKELGIRNGTDQKTARVLRPTELTEEMDGIRRDAREHGMEVQFIRGYMEIKAGDRTLRARGATVGNRLIVQTDNLSASFYEIYRHERLHGQIASGEIELEKAVQLVRETIGEKRFAELLPEYRKAYAGVYSGERFEQNAMEELCADAAAGLIPGAKAVDLSSIEGGQKNSAPEGDKFRIERTREMSWEDQINGVLDKHASIKRNDTLVISDTPEFLVRDGVTQRPLAIPQRVITKAQDGRDYYHMIGKGKLRRLQDGVLNPIAVIDNPDKNSLVYITSLKQGGLPIVVSFRKNVEFDGDAVHQGTSIHIQADVASMLKALPSNAKVYVKNNSKLNEAVGVANNLRSLAAQIEFTDDNIAQNKGKSQDRFSVSEPVEETRDLIAVHNLTEENLASSLDLGGLPSPSIAVIRAEQGHSKYGPISIVFDKSTIDPQADSRNKIYGSDAWTPTVPRVEYQVNSKRAGDLEYALNDLAGQTAGGIFSSSSALRSLGIDDASSLSREQLAEKLADNDTVRAAYLADRGQTLEPERMVKQFNKYGNEALQMLIDRVGVPELAGAVAEMEIGNRDAVDGISETVREIIRDTYEQNNRSFLDRKPELKQARLDRYMENNVSRVAVEDFVKDAWEMYQDGGQTRDEIDRLATREKLREAVNTEDVQRWIDGKLDGVLGKAGIYNGKDRHTPSGNSCSFAQLHYDYTLENIVRAMNGLQQARGEGIWGASAESFVAVGTPSYQSIDEVRADKGRLREATEEEYDALKARLDPMIEEIITGVMNTNEAHSDNQFEEIDIVGSLLLDAAKGTKTKAAIRSVFRKNGYTISDALISKAQSLYSEAAKMPTKYFEAKPQRAVSFDEARAIIVPDNTSAALVQRLEAGGANVVTYPAGDEQARLAALNGLRDVRFSVSGEEYIPESAAEYSRMQRGGQPAVQTQEERQREETLYSHMTERAFELRRQFTEGTARDLNAEEIPEIASDLLRFAGKKAMGRGELEGRLSDIAEKAARSRNPMEAYQIAKEEADYLAADMLRNASGQTEEAQEMWDDIRKTMRTGGRPVKLAIGGQNRADLDVAGGYEAVRKRLMGYGFLSPSGMPVEVFYEQELTPRFPSCFPADIQNPADQLLRIVDVLDRFRQIFKSPFAGELAEDTQLLSQEILQRLYNANVEAPSAAAFAQQHEEMLQAHYEKRLADTKARMQDEMEAMKQRFAEKRSAERTARQEQKDRDALLHIAQRLSRVRDGSPWKAKAAELVGNLDTVAKSMMGRTIIGDRIGNLSTEGIETIGEDDLGRKIVDIHALRQWVEEMKESNPDFIPDKKTMDKLNRVERVQIADMSIGDVRALLEVMQHLENEIRTAKKLIDAEDRRDVAIQTAETISDIRGSKGVPLTGAKATWNRLIINEGLSPVRFLHRVTGYNDADPLYRATQALQKGETAMHDYTRRAEAMFRGFMEDRQFMASLAGEKARTIQITGLDESGHSLTVPITPDMQIAIFLHSFNNDNIRHAERGGFVIPNLALLRKGKVEEAYTSGTLLRLRRSQMKAVEQNMTEREVQFARAVYRYFNGMSKSEQNEVSRKLLGYDVATVQNYYPIETSRDFARGEPETVKRDGTIEGSGHLKSREGAAGPINLRGVTDTLERFIAQHSKYVGLAIPIRNFGKIYGNSTWRITPTEETGALITQDVAPSSLRRVLNQKWGAGAGAYIDKLMADLQSPAKEIDAWAKTMGKVRSNYAGAVLTMNASVAIKQAASYPTAAAVVGWKPLMKALPYMLPDKVKPGETVDIKFVAAHTPLLWYRSKGYSTQELGDMAKGKKQIPKGLNWVQGIDVKTVKALWKAAEYYVQQEQPTLERRSDAYWDAVTEIYERIVLETQPDYTTMERPQLLRSRNTLLQNLAMFKTQPFQNFNIAYDALANLQAKEQQLKAAQDAARRDSSEETRASLKAAQQNLKNAKKGASRAVSALLISAGVFSAMTLLWNVIRGNMRRYKDKDKGEVTAASFLKTFGSDTAGSLAGILPFGSDAYEVFAALVLDQQYYGMEALTPSAISDFLEQVATLDDTIANIGKALKGDASAMDSLQTVNRLGSTASKLFGAPVENIENIVKAAAYWVMKPFMSKEEADYWYRYYTTKTTAQGRRNEDKADIYAVYRSGDKSAYESMRAAMEKWIWQANSRYQSGELTREEAQASAGETMDSAMAAQIKEDYIGGGITETEATGLLQEIGGKDADRARDAVNGWRYQRDGGSRDASASMASAYYEYAKPAGISIEQYETAWQYMKNTTADKDESGKTISGSKKEKIVAYIQSLGLPKAAERALWNALKGTWSDEGTPWA